MEGEVSMTSTCANWLETRFRVRVGTSTHQGFGDRCMHESRSRRGSSTLGMCSQPDDFARRHVAVGVSGGDPVQRGALNHT